MFNLIVPFSQSNPDDIPRPWLKIVLSNPGTGKSMKTYGIIDTGADECALPAHYAPILGHDLQAGKLTEISTGNGVTMAYSHTVSFSIDGFEVKNVLIDFMPNLSVPLLGVKSFLSNFILTVDYPNQEFSLVQK